MNYYDSILIKIKNLCESNKEEAIKKIEEELSYPYIPIKFEQELTELLTKIKKPTLFKNVFYSEEDIEKMLRGKDEEFALAFNQLTKMQLDNYLILINELLLAEQYDDNRKRYLLLLLLKNKCKDKLKVYINNQNYVIDLQNYKLPKQTASYQKIENYLNNYFYKNPSLCLLSKQYLSDLAFSNLPNIWLDVDVNKVARLIIEKIEQNFN